jgi:hypothetical protein
VCFNPAKAKVFLRGVYGVAESIRQALFVAVRDEWQQSSALVSAASALQQRLNRRILH